LILGRYGMSESRVNIHTVTQDGFDTPTEAWTWASGTYFYEVPQNLDRTEIHVERMVDCWRAYVLWHTEGTYE
jgi:hypothetical protein